MIVTHIFLLKSLNSFVGIKYVILQNVSPNKIKNIGSKPVNKTLNMPIFGVVVMALESFRNQSNDINASVVVPIFSAGNNTSDKDDGNFRLNDIAAVSSWR